MTSRAPTHPVSEVEVPTVDEVDPNDLALAVAEADPGALLMSLVHLTGDVGLVDEFAGLLAAAREQARVEGRPPAIMGEYPREVADEVRSRATALLGTSLRPRLGVPDDELFRRMASVCTDDEVPEEFVAHLREQGGFERARRVVPTTRKPSGFRVGIVGAGMIGINAAIKLGEAGFDYEIFEERDELGGTWSRNTYPGAAVDTASHFYSFSFELKSDWSKFYPLGPEYLEYLEKVADKYDVTRHIRFDTSVLGLEWFEEDQQWEVTVRGSDGRARKERFNAVVTATGVLNGASIPDVDGADTFRGEMVHTAQWQPETDLRGKRVVVLGTGCTAVQVVAGVVDEVEELHVVFRQPHWIIPERRVVEDVPDGMRWALATVPYLHQWFRLKSYWWASDKGWSVPRIDDEWYATHVSASPINDAMMQNSLAYMDRVFPDRPDLKEKLTPDFPPFAKRIVKDPGFFQALKRDHVSVHRAGFAEIRPDGVVTTEGEFLPADVIVWATGFKIEFLSFLDVIGRDGVKLADRWADDDPRAYLGITVPGFPNLFVTAGPNAAPNHGGGHNNTSEAHVQYVVESLQYLVEHELTSMEPSVAATDEYNARVDESLERTVWAHPRTATGYYRNRNGRPWIQCPWRLVDYWQMLRAPTPDDYVFTAGPAVPGPATDLTTGEPA